MTYLSNSVDDIQLAISEKNIQIDNATPLGEYGNKIREIKTGVDWADYRTLVACPSITEDDFVVQEYSDVTGTIEVVQNSYTTL